MKRKPTKKLMTLLLALVMIASCLVSPAVASPASTKIAVPDSIAAQPVTNADGHTGYGEASLTEGSDREITIMVSLEDQTMYQQTSDLQLAATGRNEQMTALAKAENRIEAALSAPIAIENRYSLLFNGFSFTGESWMIEAINAMDGVYAFEAPVFTLVEPETADKIDMTPSMSNSTNLTTATKAWELGYTGEGMVVAVIDTGIRQTHEAFSVMPENGKIDLAYLRDVYAQYGDVIHAGSLADIGDIFYNEKLPFNWDYFDGDADPNHTSSDHGTHVAGIAAGNNGEDFFGVAPYAQVVTLQVFNDDGGASFDTLLLALEDCVYLGVDAINMSLGIPAYFTSYESMNSYMEDIYNALESAGISICAAAGNDYHSNVVNNLYEGYYNGDWFAWNPDAGTIGAPATLAGSFAVASVENTNTTGGFFEAYGEAYYPYTVEDIPGFGKLENKDYEIVYVGLASPEEIEAAGGVEGKIALAQRGTLTFTDKCTNVTNAGAVACILFNNTDGVLNPSVACSIPLATLTMADGLKLIEQFSDGVHGTITVDNSINYRSIVMAPSSSWGTTADLKIKPEIAAPGDGITSSIGFDEDDSYESWGGTSMATPHIAGGMLLIKQRLREVFPEKTAAEINQLAYAFMMSTAHQVTGMVRQQGAGLMDLGSVLTTDAYLSVPGSDRPKLELGENEDGKFTFAIEVNNFSEETKTYTVVPSVMTELANELVYTGYNEIEDEYYREFNKRNDFFVSNPTPTTVKTMYGAIREVTNLCDITAPETITVAAGKTVTINMTIQCGEELMDYIHENFVSGIYLEGFIALQDQSDDGVDLSVPFLGFVGDWDYVPMFDQGFWWQIPYGVNNMSQMPAAQGTFIGAAVLEQGLGMNPYWDEDGQIYSADRHAISPNGDGFLDAVTYIEFNLMRIPKTMKLYVTDAEGNILETLHESTYNYRKEYMTAGYVSFSSMPFNYTADELEENETAYLVLEAWLDHEGYDPADNQNGRMVFPVTKDLTAPTVRTVEGGIEIQDNQYTAYYAIYADLERTELIAENGLFAEERGAVELVETDMDVFYVAVADYAQNEAFYMVSDGAVVRLEEDGFGHNTKTIVARQFIDWNEGVYRYGFYHYNPETPNHLIPVTEFTDESDYAYGGYDFKSAAVAADGTLYVITIDDLYIMDPETYEVTRVNTLWSEGGTPRGRCIMVNPETYEMYIYFFMAGKQQVGKLNTETAEIETIWIINERVPAAGTLGFGMTFIDGQTMVIVDGDGNLWLVNAEDGREIVKYGGDLYSYVGVNSMGGSILYDKDLNKLYIYNNWGWFRYNREGTGGMLEFDLDTQEMVLRTTGLGDGVTIEGLFFKEDVKPADFYICMELINAIGEVTLDSKEAIEAARAAYDGLTDQEKSRVDNYETLVNAERKYQTLIAENAALNAAKSYALLVINDLEKEAADDTCLLNTIEAAREAIGYATSVDEVYAILDSLRLLVAEGCVSNRFSDVAVNAWYHDSVEFVVAFGLMEGMGGKTFAPGANMTRAQLVTVLYRLVGEPEVDGMVNPFTDVAADTWYTDAVIWAANNGIITGVTETTFAPNANISREQLVTILYRFFGEPETNTDVLAGYADANAISEYAVDAMAWAVENGIVNGITETVLAPQGTATRAQIATILMRVILG